MPPNPLMPEFENKTPTKTTPTEIDLAHAARLKQILADARLLTAPAKYKSKWPHEFRLLAKFVDKPRVDAALDWIGKNTSRIALREAGVPQIRCAASFRRCFNWIEDLIAKDLKNNPTCVETPTGKKVYDWALRFRWPAGSDKKLRPAVEQSLTAHAGFIEAVKHLIKTGTDDKTVRFAKELLTHMSDPNTFFDRWWRDVYNSVKNWKAWTGDVVQFSWTCDHRRMMAIGREVARRYCGTAARYDKLVEALK